MIMHTLFVLLVLSLFIVLAAPICWLMYQLYVAPGHVNRRNRLVVVDGLGAATWTDCPMSVASRREVRWL